MRYFTAIVFVFCFLSCHNPASTETKHESTTTQQDSGIDKNLIITPEEMHDDTVFNNGSRPADWSVSGIGDPNQLKIFIKNLRFWVEHGNKDSIAHHIQYPLQKQLVNSPEEFIKNYDNIFNKKVINALNDQKLSQIFRNQQGAMLGDGMLWIRNFSPGFEEDFKIVAINN